MSEFEEFPARSLSDVKALLQPASSLGQVEEDMGDFEGGRYRGFLILDGIPPETPATHQSLPRRFYVTSPNGTPGLVPFPGSTVIWPWERGWVQDLHAEKVDSLLRPEKKKGR